MDMKLDRTIVTALICGMLPGCSGEESQVSVRQTRLEQQDNLAGTAWQAENIDPGGVVDMSMVTIEFAPDSRIAGSTGCNRYFGSVNYDDSNFSVAEVGSTQKACPPAIMEQERRFLDALESAVRFDIQDDMWLRLFDVEGKQRLKFIMSGSGTIMPAAKVQQPQDKPTGTVTRYSCTDGPDFDVRFLGPDTIGISTDERDYVLQHERAASGARYAGDGIEFWNKGNEALLVSPEGRFNCTTSGTDE